MRTRLDQYAKLLDALVHQDWTRLIQLFDALGQTHPLTGTLADIQATGDPRISTAGLQLFNAETATWNAAVEAFNQPRFEAIAAAGGPWGDMATAFGVLTKAIDDFVTRVDTGDEADCRVDPNARPPMPVDHVRIAPRRDTGHPWFGQPPLISSPGRRDAG